MKKSILKHTFVGIAATVGAVSFGYLAVQYLGQYIMFALGAGIFGLGAAAHRNQQLPPQKSLPEAPRLTELQPQVAQSAKDVKRQHDNSTAYGDPTRSRHSSTDASRLVKPGLKIKKVAIKEQSEGYCRKRLALCHRAKVESSIKIIPKK